MNKLERHLRKEKYFYYGVGTGVVVVGLSWYLMRTNSRCLSTRLARPFYPTGQASSIISSPFASIDSYNTTNNYTAKRLSYIVSQNGTDNWWRSQADAARELGVTPGSISEHLNHGSPLTNGISLTRQGVAQ